MRDVEQDDLKAKEIVESTLGIAVSEPFSGLVFLDGAIPIGAAIFNNYSRRDVNFTCVLLYGDVGIRICRRVAHYIFNVMECRRVTAVTPRSNIAAITALEKLGFKWEGTLREYFRGDEDGHIFGLLAQEQKLLRRGFDGFRSQRRSGFDQRTADQAYC